MKNFAISSFDYKYHELGASPPRQRTVYRQKVSAYFDRNSFSYNLGMAVSILVTTVLSVVVIANGNFRAMPLGFKATYFFSFGLTFSLGAINLMIQFKQAQNRKKIDQENNFNRLPVEIVEFIFEYLDPKSAAQLAMTNKDMYTIIKGMNKYWKRNLLGCCSDQDIALFSRIVQDNNVIPYYLYSLTRKGLLTAHYTSTCLEGHNNAIQCLTMVGDDRLVSGSRDGSIRVWDVKELRELFCFEEHNSGGRVQAVASLSALGRDRVVSFAYDCTVRVWDVREGKHLLCINANLSGLTFWLGHSSCVAVMGDDRIVFLTDFTKIKVWSIAENREISCFEEGAIITCLDAIGDHRIVFGANDGAIRVWDISEKKQLFCLQGHSTLVSNVAEMGDDRVVSGSFWDKTVRVWDIKDGKQLFCIEDRATFFMPLGLTVIGDNRIMFGTCSGSIRVWDVKEEQISCLRTAGSVISCIKVTKSGQIVSGHLDNKLRIWRLKTEKIERYMKLVCK